MGAGILTSPAHALLPALGMSLAMVLGVGASPGLAAAPPEGAAETVVEHVATGEAANDAARACPALAGPLSQARAGRLLKARPEKDIRGDAAWQRIDHFADGKQGSGITVFRRFEAVGAAGPTKAWKLTLALGEVEQAPSLVTLYGIDGLQLPPRDQHRFWRLQPEGMNLLTVTVRPQPGGVGGIAIATCQAGRMSILVTTVPQGSLRQEPATGRLDQNAAHQPIVDMRAPLVSPKP